MKVLISLWMLAFSATAFGFYCEETIFEKTKNYYEIEKSSEFENYYRVKSPKPAKLLELAHEWFDDEGFCFYTEAHYFTHKKSGKNYVMFTTYEDACDGGNTLGVIVDMEKYLDAELENSIVAKVDDSQVNCIK